MPEAEKSHIKWLWLVVAVLIFGALAVVGVWQPWHDRVAEMAITISGDGIAPQTIYEKRVTLSSKAEHVTWPTQEIDLGRWAGKLARLDFELRLRDRQGVAEEVGVVACAAQIAAPGVSQAVEFTGWINDGDKWFRHNRLGSPALVAPGGHQFPFVYSTQERLWHVLQVPGEAELRVTFKPFWTDTLLEAPRQSRPGMETEWLPRASGQNAADARPPDLFIYLIDALRADHLGCYGYARPTSPAIDAFAREAVLFEQAQSTTTWTLPSVVSLLCGLFPSAHGVTDGKTDKVAQWTVLLPEMLKEAGYNTSCVATNAYISAEYGLGRGIDYFKQETLQTPDWANAQLEAFLAPLPADEPAFSYLHALEPHAPYAPEAETFARFDRGYESECDGSIESLRALGVIHPEATSDDLGHLIDLYDAEIADNDAGFAQFLEILKSSGRYENAMIILVADHGEAFNEHGTLEHGRTLSQEEMRVPLVVRFPGGEFAGTRVQMPVSLVDVLPTIIARLGLRPPAGYRLAGWDLETAARAPAEAPRRRIFAELNQKLSGKRLELVAAIDEAGFKRVMDLVRPNHSAAAPESLGLWDITDDPQEANDISAAHPVRAAYHEQIMAGWMLQQQYWRGGDTGAETTPAETVLSEEKREELRALGYLD